MKGKHPITTQIKNLFYILKIVSRVNKWLVPFMLFFSVVRGVNTFFSTTYIYKYAINSLQLGVNYSQVLLNICGMLALMLFYIILLNIKNYIMEKNKLKIESAIFDDIFCRVTSVDLDLFEKASFYDKYHAVMSKAPSLAIDTINALCDLVNSSVVIISVLSLVVTMDPVFVLLAIIPGITTWIIGNKRSNLRHERDVNISNASREKEYVRRVFFLRDYSKELRLTDMYKVMIRQMHESILKQKKIIKESGSKLILIESVLSFGYEIVVYFGAVFATVYKSLIKNAMPYGDCFVVVNSITQISYIFGSLGDTIISLGEISLHINDLKLFFDAESKMITTNNLNREVTTLAEVTFKNVCFTYPGANKKSIDNISMSIKKGERIALVGENGSGKTTLIKLLLRLYEPSSGEIRYNDHLINEYNLFSYQKNYGILFQGYHLFAMSVSKNVMHKDALTFNDEEKVKHALETVGLLDKIMSHPKGINSIVGREFDSDGIVLSGGEEQRLALAHAIVYNPQIVVLDEPSSAMDPIAENALFNQVLDICKDKTIIYISHRLSNVTVADRIIYLERGKIVEEGTHEELIKLKGQYAKMWNRQASKYSKIETEKT